MSTERKFNIKIGDDKREFRTTLISDEQPVSAVLVISKGGIRETRDMEEDDGQWFYRFTDADFEIITAGVGYKLEVYGTFEDSTNATYPTKGTMTMDVQARL